ncbi:hypothetical protein BOCO_0167 [Bombiscardovia coagulans]|uniref:Uncharacterized protein n=1 Tax=Bombiscardovia coagulans TaxID=686666 RepID=A0A261EVU0_9BIFI|nr:hypothetical protein BOCO_0167 [Bombiscardovia coagulans]
MQQRGMQPLLFHAHVLTLTPSSTSYTLRMRDDAESFAPVMR